MVVTSLRLCWSLVLLQNDTNSKHHYKHQHCEQSRVVAMITQPTSAASLPLVCTSPSTSHSDCPSLQMHQCRLQGKGRGRGMGKGRGMGGHTSHSCSNDTNSCSSLCCVPAVSSTKAHAIAAQCNSRSRTPPPTAIHTHSSTHHHTLLPSHIPPHSQ